MSACSEAKRRIYVKCATMYCTCTSIIWECYMAIYMRSIKAYVIDIYVSSPVMQINRIQAGGYLLSLCHYFCIPLPPNNSPRPTSMMMLVNDRPLTCQNIVVMHAHNLKVTSIMTLCHTKTKSMRPIIWCRLGSRNIIPPNSGLRYFFLTMNLCLYSQLS